MITQRGFLILKNNLCDTERQPVDLGYSKAFIYEKSDADNLLSFLLLCIAGQQTQLQLNQEYNNISLKKTDVSNYSLQLAKNSIYQFSILQLLRAIQHSFVFNYTAGLSLQRMKKFFVFLLLLITAAGTFIPCCGVDDCCADQVTNTTNHDKHKNEGGCSPFFACATCTSSIEMTKPVQIEFPNVEKIIHHKAIVKFDLSTYSSSFWQPPRSC